MSKMKALPIGIEDFKEMIDKDYYFVDKSLLIRDLLEKKTKVCLITRPRRFGKTLNMSMIRRFFEKTDEDNAYLFEGLKISECGEEFLSHQGQYPVISISLKSMKQETYENAFEVYKKILSSEFDRHKYILNSDTLSGKEKKQIQDIIDENASDVTTFYALRFLTDCLFKVTGKKVVILIDEYDVPLESSYFCGFYDKMVGLIRNVFEGALKTNPNLEFAVLTGCLRVSKESIFTGLNNMSVYSVTKNPFSEYFGFTQPEVENMASYYGIPDRLPELKEWYDGYKFGNTEIYNPWSIIQYIESAVYGENISCLAYWINTSSNNIIHELIAKSNPATKKMIENLMEGGSVKAPIYEDSVYSNLDVNKDNIWSFLLFTGYLKQIESELIGNKVYSTMIIPNREVMSIYETTIQNWFEESVNKEGGTPLLAAVLSEDPAAVQNEINKWLARSISYHDALENFYHGFVTGLLVGSATYEVKSNRENGDGRTDLTVCEFQTRSIAFVIEIKIAEEFRQLDEKCDEAIAQIRRNKYDKQLTDDCYKRVVRYGVAFYKKACKVKMDAEPV